MKGAEYDFAWKLWRLMFIMHYLGQKNKLFIDTVENILMSLQDPHEISMINSNSYLSLLLSLGIFKYFLF